MENKKISNFLFKKKLFEKLKIRNIINYYGLVEQTGSIFIECEKCESFEVCGSDSNQQSISLRFTSNHCAIKIAKFINVCLHQLDVLF